MPTRKTAQRYRAEAKRCRELAARADNPDIAERLLKIADTYEDLARQVEALPPEVQD